ncbi:MAG: helix-turn-helix domain-containing protein [Patescibacteria group bacterium]
MDTMQYGNLDDKASDKLKDDQIARKLATGCRKLIQMFQDGMIPESDMRSINYMVDNLVQPDRNLVFNIGEVVEVHPGTNTAVAIPSRVRIPLRRKEYQVLQVLVFHEGRMISKEQLYQLVWDGVPTRSSIRLLYTTLNGLKKKLAHAAGKSVVSRSKSGYYCLELPVEVVRNV